MLNLNILLELCLQTSVLFILLCFLHLFWCVFSINNNDSYIVSFSITLESLPCSVVSTSGSTTRSFLMIIPAWFVANYSAVLSVGLSLKIVLLIPCMHNLLTDIMCMFYIPVTV